MKITEDSSVEEVLKAYPKLARVFIEHGLPCLVCGESFWGTIEELARPRGKDVTRLIDELNKHKNNENV